jgi:PAS domain S-box-containing protein
MSPVPLPPMPVTPGPLLPPPPVDRGLVDFTPGNPHTARLRHVLWFAVSAYAVVLVTSVLFRNGSLPARAGEAVTMVALGAALVVFSRRPRLATALTTAAIWSEAAFAFALHGSARSTSLLVFPVVVAIAGLLFGTRWSVRAALATGLHVPLVALAYAWFRHGRLQLSAEDLHWLLVHGLLIAATAIVTCGVLRSVHRDVAARQAAETALHQSDERFRLAMEAVSDGVWDWDIASDRGYFSPGYYRMLGYEPGEFPMTGSKWAELLHPEDRERAVAANRDCIENRRPAIEVEFRMRTKDGGWRWILGRGTAVRRDAQGRAVRVIGTHLDITGRKQAESDRLVLGKLESTGVLAGGIAHDFNNLLTIILLGLECVRSEPPGSENARASLADIETAALTARDLAAQLIAFARGGEPALRECRLEPLLRQAATFALSGSPIAARITAPADLWTALADADQIAQVFRHLVLNAREAMPAGGIVTLAAANWAHDGTGAPGLPPGDYLRIQVSDTGAGIPAGMLPRVFDPYFSTKQRGTQKGMGLGLTVCHAVVQRHGGALLAASEPGRGSVFTVCLRAVRTTAPVPPAAAELPPAPAGRRILVMDDERTLRQMLLVALQRRGHEVSAAADGQEAIDLFLQAQRDGRPFDLVLLDLTVRNGLGGVETLRLLRQHDPAVRAVAMSGHTEDDAIRDCARFGFAAALGKPFTTATLHAALVAVAAETEGGRPT